MKDKPVQTHTTEGKAEQSRIKKQSETQAQTALTLDELTAGITEQNRHAEVEYGPAVGNEVW